MITVNIPFEMNKVTTPPIYQWDYGRVLKITGDNIPSVCQVHFCDRTCDKTTVRIAYPDGEGIKVAIPDKLLENKWDINAFLYVQEFIECPWVQSTTEGEFYTREPNGTYTKVTLPEDLDSEATYYMPSAKTLKHIQIPVLERKKPEEITDPLTPSEIVQIEAMVAATNQALEEIERLYNTTITYAELIEEVEGFVEEKAEAKVNEYAATVEQSQNKQNDDILRLQEITEKQGTTAYSYQIETAGLYAVVIKMIRDEEETEYINQTVLISIYDLEQNCKSIEANWTSGGDHYQSAYAEYNHETREITGGGAHPYYNYHVPRIESVKLIMEYLEDR